MNTRPENTPPIVRPASTEPKRSALLWELHRILRNINLGEGSFRAITGRWPAQLSDNELRAWLAWFSAPTDAGEPLPPAPLERQSAALPPIQRQEGPGSEGFEPRRREMGPERHSGPDSSGQSRHGPDRQFGGQHPRDDRRPPLRTPPLPRQQPQQPQPQPQQAPPQQAPQPQPQQAPPQQAPQPLPELVEEQPVLDDHSSDLTGEERTFIEAIRNGAQVREAAQRAGVSLSTLYQRRTRKPSFGQAWQAALAERSAAFDGSDE